MHLSMPGYIDKALERFDHKAPSTPQNSPYPHTKPQYGAKIQYATDEDATPVLGKEEKKFIQQVTGTLLYYARAVDSTLLTPLSAIASQQAAPTVATMEKVRQILDYVASQEEAVLTFNASKMILAVHSDAGYLNEPNARSRAGGHFYLSSDDIFPPNNGAILNIAQIIKHVMSSAAEAELGALFINAKEAIYIRRMLQEMGHEQPRTPIQTDNSTAEGVINNKIQPKRTKAMDMRFYWLRCQEAQNQFRFYWRPGGQNLADYWTKHHPAAHHQNIRAEFLTKVKEIQQLREEMKASTRCALAVECSKDTALQKLAPTSRQGALVYRQKPANEPSCKGVLDRPKSDQAPAGSSPA
jgi:hypothetical protein